MASRGRRKPVGVVEMAHDLGVSTATISRALNGSPSVRRELADRIRAYAEARGYVANRLARALSASTSRAFVGFVIPYVDTLAYSAVAAECARLLSAAGTQMILAITENDAEREYEQLRDLVGTRIAGLVISPSTHLLDETRHLLAELPVVELHRVSGIDVPSVLSDDEQALADAIVHLAALGHTEIAYLGTPRELSNGAIRLRGIRRGVAQAGLDPRRITMRLVEPTQENGRAAACDLLAGGVPFTALVVGSGSLSVGAADAVRRSGRRLPDDLSLVVYGDPDWFVLADPPLTMIQVSYAGLARIAARLLLSALDAREVGTRPPVAGPRFMRAELSVAGSTGSPPGRPPLLPPPPRHPTNSTKEYSVTDSALAGLRVIDAATLAAGPLIATWMGEQGAEVIKVEQPDGGDPLRQWGAQRDGIGLMWKSVARNKKCVTLNLRLEAGRDLLRSLTREADVLIMNLRPSTLRKWGLAYESLAAANPGLVMVHVTGYGAGGPKSDWPGFGTLGEAMSGFAHLTGTPDGPPTLPSFMLADGVAGLTATYAVMMALYHRDARGGTGQLIDINLIEPLARLLEQSVLTYDQLGTIPVRTGNRWDISAPRNTYRTSDGRWLAMSGSAPTIAMRALRAVGRPELTEDPKFAEAQQRLRNAAEIDAIMAGWIGQRTLAEALAVFEEAGVAAAPIYDAEQLLADPQLQARGSYPSVDDAELGSMRIQAPVPRFSVTPGTVTHLGPRLGEHNAEVYQELLGLDAGRLEALHEQGVI